MLTAAQVAQQLGTGPTPDEVVERLIVRFMPPEDRARWHLELLGVNDLFTHDGAWEWAEPFDDGWDEDDDGRDCTRCGGEGYTEVDDPMWDPCDEFGYGPCNACRGTGERRHQWVF